ncbi:S-type pyocin domain-containing protein [Pseudomonas sp. 18175]|uniref:S-type pyocin domain-containing protein n=1 Tax=Pseudomonas sp. 18175 TaxID=3390056 RepID=UPI003D1BB0C9
MKRYNITTGATTTAGGKVISGWERARFRGEMVARAGDRVSCPACGTVGVIVCVGPHLAEHWGGKEAALEGDLCLCECKPSPTLIANQRFKCQDFTRQPQPDANSRTSPPPSNFSTPSVTSRSADVCVFAKSCVSVPAGSTAAGQATERASNFGTTALLASTGAAGTVGRVAGTLGSELGTWAVRGVAGASAAVNFVLLAFLPRDIGDSTLYTPEQLANMQSASTRVRFQFRQDETGEIGIYGIHTKPGSGSDRVPVAHARWNTDKSAMVAVLDGISIIWTPNNGPVVSAPSPYPGASERLDNLLVHPIAAGQDSAITHYPGRDAEDLTWLDTIITFPADSGVAPLYLVFAKPAVKPLEVDVYGAFDGRPRNGLHVDHMPSQAALRRVLKEIAPDLSARKIQEYLKNAASVAIPAHTHRQYSETYGGRNSEARQTQDAYDLRAAVDSNLSAIKPYLLSDGYSAEQIETVRRQMHDINQTQGWYQ